MSVKQELQAHIDEGTIRFDNAARDRPQLLAENGGTTVSPRLQKLVNAVADEAKSQGLYVRVSSIIRSGSGTSRHESGHGFDVGNEDIASAILPVFATASRVATYAIDEIIFDAAVAGEPDRNRWNYDAGLPHAYASGVLGRHRDHIHFSVRP